MAIRFPDFDPAAIRLGPFAVRWYALAYIAGLLAGWQLMRRLVRQTPVVATAEQVDDFLTYATLGVILGGRLGYILFYQPGEYLSHPLQILEVWKGGMSFHGGFLGVCAAALLFTRQRKLNVLGFADRIAVITPIGLGLGRIANFVNGELWGRPAPADLPWAVVFDRVDLQPRHPSQLYQAAMEGVLLFAILWFASRSAAVRARSGMLTGIFLAGYGTFRSIGEIFREPDQFLGFLWAGATMGQILSAPMIIVGLSLITYATRKAPWQNG